MWPSFGWSTIRNLSEGKALSTGSFQKVQREVIYFPYVPYFLFFTYHTLSPKLDRNVLVKKKELPIFFQQESFADKQFSIPTHCSIFHTICLSILYLYMCHIISVGKKNSWDNIFDPSYPFYHKFGEHPSRLGETIPVSHQNVKPLKK